MITLYQFAVSHYCEKVRWALKFKRLPHKTKSLLPGLHASKMIKLVGASSVPVIQDEGKSIGGAASIIDYLDENYPRFPLTPEDDQAKKESIELERWADDNIGPQVRVLAYSVLTQHPDLLKGMMAQGGPWYKSFYMKHAIPKVIAALRKGYNIDDKNVKHAKATLHEGIEKLRPKLGQGTPLVGGNFSRADLAVASLWAPMFQVSRYGLDWPEHSPPELDALAEEFEEIRPWVEAIYLSYR